MSMLGHALALALWLGPPATADTTTAAFEGPLVEREFAAPSKRARFLDSAPFDLATGNSRRGEWALELSAGFPWQRLRVQGGLGHRLSLAAELDSALGRRLRPALGLSLRWVDRPHVRLSGELLLGWQWVLTPELAARGPSGELRMRLAFPIRRVAPYLVLGSRHTLLPDRTTIVDAEGTRVDWSVRHRWTGWGSAGLVVALGQHVGLDFGLDFPWVDAPTPSIPGVHLGLVIGGWR